MLQTLQKWKHATVLFLSRVLIMDYSWVGTWPFHCTTSLEEDFIFKIWATANFYATSKRQKTLNSGD